MKIFKKFIAVIIVFSFCGSMAWAEEYADGADGTDALMQKINSAEEVADIEEIVRENKLDDLCNAVGNGYTESYSQSDFFAVLQFLLNEKPYDSYAKLADYYAAACIVNSDYVNLKKYLENGFLPDILGLHTKLYDKAGDRNKDKIVNSLVREKYTSAKEFCVKFDSICIENRENAGSGISSGGGGGGGGFADAVGIFEKDGTPTESITDGNEYIIRYYGLVEDGIFAAAVYSGNKLKSIDFTETNDKNWYYDVYAKLENGDTVKAFLWDGLESMTPIIPTEQIDVSEYKYDYTEGVLTNSNTIEYADENGEIKSRSYAATQPTYQYLGHRVGITSCGAYICGIKDLEDYEGILLSCESVESFSQTEIISDKQSYLISDSAKFFQDGREYNSFPYTDDDFEIYLSRKKGSDAWENIGVMNYTTGVVAYAGDTIYFENGNMVGLSKYTAVIPDSDITVGSVLSCCLDVGKVYVSNKTVNGKTEFKDNGILINDVLYDVPDLSVNTNYDYYSAYISHFSRIEKLVPDLSVYKKCLITNVYEKDSAVYAETADGDVLEITEDFVFDGQLYTPIALKDIFGAYGVLYGKIPTYDGGKMTVEKGSSVEMTFNGGVLLSQDGTADETTDVYLYQGDKFAKCNLSDNLFGNGVKLSCKLFYDDGDEEPVFVCINAAPSIDFIIDEIGTDTVSGYSNGNYVTFGADSALISGIEPFMCGTLSYLGDEMISFACKTRLGYNPVGSVLKITDKYIVYDDKTAILLAKNTNVYEFDGEKISRAELSDIVADPNRLGYGSYILYINSAGGYAADIVLREQKGR